MKSMHGSTYPGLETGDTPGRREGGEDSEREPLGMRISQGEWGGPSSSGTEQDARANLMRGVGVGGGHERVRGGTHIGLGIDLTEIQNAVTGNYIVWTTGTDVNLDPCTSGQNPTGKIPCDLSKSF
mgnify:CR=1 FL=1